jgi:hypothetical protein
MPTTCTLDIPYKADGSDLRVADGVAANAAFRLVPHPQGAYQPPQYGGAFQPSSGLSPDAGVSVGVMLIRIDSLDCDGVLKLVNGRVSFTSYGHSQDPKCGKGQFDAPLNEIKSYGLNRLVGTDAQNAFHINTARAGNHNFATADTEGLNTFLAALARGR